jgi:hypothetical protein
MSNVYDAQGNLVNNPGPGTQRYKDSNSTVIDWFDTHPRPVEPEVTKIPATVEFHATKIPATLPLNSGDTLKIVAPETETPEVAPVEPLSAGVTTSSLPQTTVTA